MSRKRQVPLAADHDDDFDGHGIELEEDFHDEAGMDLDDDAGLSELLQPSRPASWITQAKTVRYYTRQTQPESIFDGILVEGFYSVLVGEDGSGKSMLALKIGHAVANGLPLLGRNPEPRPVLYLDRENPLSAIEGRMNWLKSWDGGNLTYLGLHTPEGVPWLDTERGQDAILNWINRQKKRPLIIVDSLIRFLPPGAEINSDMTSDGFLRTILPYKGSGCAFLVLEHTGKGETTKKGKGTKDWDASCDIKYLVTNLSDDRTKLTRLQIQRERSRDFKREMPKLTTIDFSDDGDVTLGKIKTTEEMREAGLAKMSGKSKPATVNPSEGLPPVAERKARNLGIAAAMKAGDTDK